jgi:hypothetical protein
VVETLELVAVVVDDLFLEIADDDDELLGPEVCELLEAVRQERLAVDLDEPFWFVLGEWTEPRPLAGREDDCFHTPVTAG